jgi:hypothetical protein
MVFKVNVNGQPIFLDWTPMTLWTPAPLPIMCKLISGATINVSPTKIFLHFRSIDCLIPKKTFVKKLHDTSVHARSSTSSALLRRSNHRFRRFHDIRFWKRDRTTYAVLQTCDMELQWSDPLITLTGNRWLWRTRSVQALQISLVELVVKVGAVFYWCVWPIVGMWSDRSVSCAQCSRVP